MGYGTHIFEKTRFCLRITKLQGTEQMKLHQMLGSLELTVIFLPNHRSKLIRDIENYLAL